MPELQAEIGETQHYDDEEMRELLTMFYEDHLGVTESDDSEYESDDGGAGDFSALDQALEESEHFNPDSPWVEFKDERGKSYFFNSETDKPSGTCPRRGSAALAKTRTVKATRKRMTTTRKRVTTTTRRGKKRIHDP